jgi:hypothetical protein
MCMRLMARVESVISVVDSSAGMENKAVLVSLRESECKSTGHRLFPRKKGRIRSESKGMNNPQSR